MRVALLNARCALEKALLGLAETATSDNALAGDPLRVVGRKESNDGGDVVDPACTAERGLRHKTFLEIRTDEACALSAFGIDDAGIDGVDADLFRTEFLG